MGNFKTLFILAVLVLLYGCSNTTVHLHANNISEEEREKIRSDLEQQGFSVKIRDNELPSSENIILYYPHKGIDNDLRIIDEILEASGLRAGRNYGVQTGKIGRHEYTAGNIGVYIVSGIDPNGSALTTRVRSVFPMTMIGEEFLSTDCEEEYLYEFFDDGVAAIGRLEESLTSSEGSDATTLTWIKSSDDVVAIFADGEQFEYRKTQSHREHIDQHNRHAVTYIIRLNPINYYRVPFGCNYESSYFESF